MTGMSLAQAIASLRAELQEAIAEGQNEDLRFTLESIDLELTIALTSGVEGSASAGLWKVLTIGGKANASTAETHRLMLKLNPALTGTPGPVQVDSRVDRRPD